MDAPLYLLRALGEPADPASDLLRRRETQSLYVSLLASLQRPPPRTCNPLGPLWPANRPLVLRAALETGAATVMPPALLQALVADLRSAIPLPASEPAPSPREQGSRTAVVVLGMHRSGTSALARTLNLCGAHLPDNLLPPKLGDNPKGYWEAERIVSLNDHILARLKGSWLNPGFELPEQGKVVDEFLELALALLREEYAGHDTILIKDPRICLLAPLWQRALQAAGYRPVYVVPVRPPLEVARSLHARGSMSMDEGLDLWAAYSARIEAFTRDRDDVVHVEFGSLLKDWRSLVGLLTERLGLTLDLGSRAAEVDAFLEPDLRHHAQQGKDERQPEDGLPGTAAALYRRMSLRCVQPPSGPARR